MSYLITPRTNADPTSVFNERCAESRLEELTKQVMQILIEQDQENFAMEHRKAFKQGFPQYSLNEAEIKEKFYEKAYKEAMRIIDQERRNVVEQRSEYIKNTLNIIIRQLRLLVYTESGKGKIYLKKVPVEGHVGENSPSERDILYFETYPEGIERHEQIGRVLSRLSEFSDYIGYASLELQQLYRQAIDLRPEIISGEKEESK